MAIYHCHCKVISRGQGRSAVGAAAYRSGETITNDYDGLTHDYTKKGGVVHSEIMLCKNAPQEYRNRAILWNEVERVEKGSKARLAREYEIALPVELNREEQIQLVRNYARKNFVEAGMCADIAIHDKEDGNPHAHIMLTTRLIEPDGSWGTKQKKEYILGKDGQKQYDPKKKTYKCRTIKVNDWDTTDFLERSRAEWAATLNRELEKKNVSRVDHRSYEAQGKEQIPTEHIGVSAKAMERRGRKSDRGERNREIKKANEKIKTINYLQSQTKKELLYIREDMRWNSQHEFIEKLQTVIANPQAAVDAGLLRKIQSQLEKIYEKAHRMKPSKASEGRTVEYDLRQIPYFEYHRNKLIADVADLNDEIKRRLATLEEQSKEPAAKEKIQGRTAEPEPSQHESASPAFGVPEAAHQLAEYRAGFIKATMQSAGRTSYQENPIYRQQAVQIADLARRVQEQAASIKQLQAEKDALGMFKGREKKALQEKITNFERLRRGNIEKLNALGVPDVSKADEVIKEKTALAAAEQAKARAARENVGAAERAEEAKAAYLSLVRSIPPELRQEVAAELERQEQAASGQSRLEYFKAEAEARRQLDPAWKPEHEHQRGQSRTRWNEPER